MLEVETPTTLESQPRQNDASPRGTLAKELGNELGVGYDDDAIASTAPIDAVPTETDGIVSQSMGSMCGSDDMLRRIDAILPSSRGLEVIDDDDAPLPVTEVPPASRGLEEIIDDCDAPMPVPEIAAEFENMEKARMKTRDTYADASDGIPTTATARFHERMLLKFEKVGTSKNTLVPRADTPGSQLSQRGAILRMPNSGHIRSNSPNKTVIQNKRKGNYKVPTAPGTTKSDHYGTNIMLESEKNKTAKSTASVSNGDVSKNTFRDQFEKHIQRKLNKDSHLASNTTPIDADSNVSGGDTKSPCSHNIIDAESHSTNNPGRSLPRTSPQRAARSAILPTQQQAMVAPQVAPQSSHDEISLSSTSSAPMFHKVEATLVPDEPVYDAIPIQNDKTPKPWWKRHQRCIYLGMGIAAGLAVAAGVSLSSNRNFNVNDNNEDRSAISIAPSLHPKLSLNPSASLPPSMSLSPSETPSLRPSYLPSASPPPSINWPSLDWVQHNENFLGEAADDLFGLSVSISGDGTILAVGAPGIRDSSIQPGCVKIYQREDVASTQWSQLGQSIIGKMAGDTFGYSISLSDDGRTVAIGAPYYGNDERGRHLGQAKIYRWDQTLSDYRQIGETITGKDAYDYFGWSVSLSADASTLAIAGPGTWLQDDREGCVNVYKWSDGLSNWEAFGETIVGDVIGDEFGWSVALSADASTLAIGAVYNDANGNDSGQVQIYGWDEASSDFRQLGQSIIGKAAGVQFGYNVAISGNGKTLIAGAPYSSKQGVNRGYAQVFIWDDAASDYRQLGRTIVGTETSDYLGWAVDVSDDGKTVAITSPGSSEISSGPGQVDIFRWDADRSDWRVLVKTIFGERYGDEFGWSVVLSKDLETVAAGAIYHDGYGIDSGQVNVFTIESINEI